MPKVAKQALLVGGLVLQLAAIYALDYLSGYELRTAIFYSLAIAYAAWHLGLPTGVLAAVTSAVLAYLAERTAGMVYPEAWIGLANAGSRLAFMLFVALSVSYFHRTMELARRKVRAFSGPIPVCTQCHHLATPDGHWCDFEAYVLENTEATFQPKVCPQCARAAYVRRT